MDTLLEGLGKYPTVLAVVSGVGATVGGVGLSESKGPWTVGAWVIGIAAFIALPALSSRRNRLHQGQRVARRCIKKLLSACAAAYGYPGVHVRTNIMLLSTGGRRRVDSGTAFNMDGDADCDLEIDATAGVSGEAFTHRATTYGDLGLALRPAGPTWGLRDSERAKVRRELRAILSVPIFDPDNVDGPLLGTLQVDSDHTFEQMAFDDPERREVAERFADVIAFLLKTGS